MIDEQLCCKQDSFGLRYNIMIYYSINDSTVIQTQMDIVNISFDH